MDYQIVIEPGLGVSADEFISAWNDDPECQGYGQAQMSETRPEAYGIDPYTTMIFVGGLIGTITVNTLSNFITVFLAKRFSRDPGQPIGFEVVTVEQQDGSYLLVLRKKAE